MTTEPRTITTNKGKSFTTTLEDHEAVAIVKERAVSSYFARSLIDQLNAKGGLSEEQWKYMHMLAVENKPTKHNYPHKFGGKLEGLGKILQDAGRTLKKPKLYVHGFRFLLIENGVVAMVNQKTKRRIGIIETDGTVWTKEALDDEELISLVLVMDFCKNPTEAAKVYGQTYSFCMFCGTEITNPNSLRAGYGPICAGHYGLPWG